MTDTTPMPPLLSDEELCEMAESFIDRKTSLKPGSGHRENREVLVQVFGEEVRDHYEASRRSDREAMQQCADALAKANEILKWFATRASDHDEKCAEDYDKGIDCDCGAAQAYSDADFFESEHSAAALQTLKDLGITPQSK